MEVSRRSRRKSKPTDKRNVCQTRSTSSLLESFTVATHRTICLGGESLRLCRPLLLDDRLQDGELDHKVDLCVLLPSLKCPVADEDTCL